MNNPIPIDTESERCQDCHEGSLVRVDHPANSFDWRISGSSQSYQVYRCEDCGDYWGCRHQFDAGTGHDDRWHRFGPSRDFRRHY